MNPKNENADKKTMRTPANTLGVDSLSTHPSGSGPGEVSKLPIEFGRYRLLKQLGAVFLAHDRELNRQVALKLPHAGNTTSIQIERFRREARLSAKLDHPNICRVYDIGEHQGRLFLTMAYVEGNSLHEIIRAKGAVVPRIAANLVRGIANAVHFAHSQGIIHRDLKPANIMVKKNQQFVIMDFGLARRYEHDDEQITATGAVLGTPAYMAPEQLRGESDLIGPQADVYSLGIILYELLVGERPFQGTLPQIYSQVLTTDSVAPAFEYGIDSALCVICRKATASDVSQRYASADDLATALRDYLSRTVGGDPSLSASSNPLSASLVAATPIAAAPMQESLAASPESVPIRRKLQHTPSKYATNGMPKLLVASALGLFVLAGAVLLGWKLKTGDWSPSYSQVATILGPLAGESSTEADREVGGTERGTLKPANNLSKVDPQPSSSSSTAPSSSTPGKSESPPMTRMQPGDSQHDKRNASDNSLKDDPQPSPSSPTAPSSSTPSKSESPPPMSALASSYSNSVGATMILIPAGTFMMGSPDSDAFAQENEKPQHSVTIGSPFYMGETEVTQGEWITVVGTSPWKGKVAVEATDYPATFVSWEDATEYCRQLSEKEGREYRLPTEAEWEYACRGGSTTVYSFGEDASILSRYGWYWDNTASERGRSSQSSEVKRKLANPFGLYDIHGNVHEWCSDRYAESYIDGAAIDPKGPENGADRVFRGGCWRNVGPLACRSARRASALQSDTGIGLGFRVVSPTSHNSLAGQFATGVGSIANSNDGDRTPFVEPERASTPPPSIQKPSSNASSQSLAKSFRSSIGATMLLIPAGEFMMGSDDSDALGADNEKPQHRVTLSTSFYIGSTELTQKQWKSVMGTDPWKGGQDSEKPTRPATHVSWEDAVEFCRRLSESEGREYRLPTEAEWEYACRGATSTAFSFGNDTTELSKYAHHYDDLMAEAERQSALWVHRNLFRHAPVPDNSRQSAFWVHGKLPNPLGLYDMHGNVNEWCGDWYADRYPDEDAIDPLGPTAGQFRVVRGGSVASPPKYCRSAFRGRFLPTDRHEHIGFRLVSPTQASTEPSTTQIASDGELFPRANDGGQATADSGTTSPPDNQTSYLRLDLSIEDSKQIPIDVRFEVHSTSRGKSGSRFVRELQRLNVRPELLEINLSKFADGEYYVYISADGYASQWRRFVVEQNKSEPSSFDVELFRKRYVVISYEFNPTGREMSGRDLVKGRVAATHWASLPYFGGDWQVWQGNTVNDTVRGLGSSADEMFGKTPMLSFHRVQMVGFGFAEVPHGNPFNELKEAPSDSEYRSISMKAEKGLMLWCRVNANKADGIGYGKVFIEDVTESPPRGITVIDSRQ